MPYKSDHIKVLKVLAADLPKRTTVKTSDIVAKGFKNEEDGDRRVRNAFRMLRKYKHVEIADRGDYRLTEAGKTFFEKLKAAGFKVPETKPAKTATVPKKVKKPVKVAKKAAPKKAAKKAAPKKDAKKASPKKAAPKAKPAPKKESKPAAKANGKTNGKPVTKAETKPAAKPETKPAPKSDAKPETKPTSQLTF
jgi:hypothetical protein